MDLAIPEKLARNCRSGADRQAWLARLPAVVAELADRWSVSLGPPFEGASAAWVAPVADPPAILKVGMPHIEAEHEIDGLRFWDGDPTARLLQFDVGHNAMLLERCEPGTPLGDLPEPEQDAIVAGLLRRLWRVPPEPHPFRPLAVMTEHWISEARERDNGWKDAVLFDEGLRLLDELPRTAPRPVLLATDLHAGNALQARREPWLVIDPKPFVGDPAYDATQHLLNCRQRLLARPTEVIGRFADLLEVDRERIRLWMFARAVVGSWDDHAEFHAFVRAVAP